ncbi:MAG: sugar phosphate isomerase/epimerase family protein [Acidimicrobiales bacterium]
MMASLGPDDLVLCSGSLSRQVTFADRLSAARAGGFAGISLWGRDYELARSQGWSDADLRSMLDDSGLSVAELDPAWWWTPGATDVAIPPRFDTEQVFSFGETELFGIADALGARWLNAVDVFGGSWSLDEAAAAFADLCDRAAEHGLLVHLEFLPWSRIADLATAWQVVDAADRANGGLAVDAWHYFRGRPDPVVLEAIPGDKVLCIQLGDGPSRPEAGPADRHPPPATGARRGRARPPRAGGRAPADRGAGALGGRGVLRRPRRPGGSRGRPAARRLHPEPPGGVVVTVPTGPP